MFCLYLVLWPFAGMIGLLPLGAYALAIIGQTAVSAGKKGVLKSITAAPLLVLTHLLYGVGFWRGLFTPLKGPAEKPSTSVDLEVVFSGASPV